MIHTIMLKFLFPIVVLTLVFGIIVWQSKDPMSGAPPYGVTDRDEIPQEQYRFEWLKNWKRPEGPARVGIQVGHYKHQEAPEELKKLRSNSGASAGSVNEVDINYKIAALVRDILVSQGIQVDLLPTTVPPNYLADVFISIHADGSDDETKSGYKFASPWRDFTGDAELLLQSIEPEYASATGIPKDPVITRNMRGYYAFSWWRFEHAIHPMTTAIIAELGFVSNFSDRRFLTNNPDIAAAALATGIVNYLDDKKLL
jgi:hypothetical protein